MAGVAGPGVVVRKEPHWTLLDALDWAGRVLVSQNRAGRSHTDVASVRREAGGTGAEAAAHVKNEAGVAESARVSRSVKTPGTLVVALSTDHELEVCASVVVAIDLGPGFHDIVPILTRVDVVHVEIPEGCRVGQRRTTNGPGVLLA